MSGTFFVEKETITHGLTLWWVNSNHMRRVHTIVLCSTGDRVMRWIFHLDKKLVELRQYFPPSQTSSTTTSTFPYGPSGNKVSATGKSLQRPQAPRDYKWTTYSATHVSSPLPDTEPYTYCGKMQDVLCVHVHMLTRTKNSMKGIRNGK